MRRRGPAAIALGAALVLVAAARPFAVASEVTVTATEIAGTPVKELKAVGTIAAPLHVVRAIVLAVDRYAAFIPYVSDSRIVGRAEGGDVLNYQRLSFGIPFVSDRHYVIRITEQGYVTAEGRPAYRIAWRLEDGVPVPPETAAIAVELNRGYWDLRPDGPTGAATAIEYCVFTDPGGSLPKWIVGQANRDAIPKLFEAVRAEAADARYAAVPAAPAPPPSAPRPGSSPGCEGAASP